MSKRVIKQLSDMSIDEISLVDRGANQHALISIAKRYDVTDAFSKARGGHTDTSKTGEDAASPEEFNGDDAADVVDDDVANDGHGDTGAPSGKTIPGTQKTKGEDITGTAGKKKSEKHTDSTDHKATDAGTELEDTSHTGEKNLPGGLKESTGDKVRKAYGEDELVKALGLFLDEDADEVSKEFGAPKKPDAQQQQGAPQFGNPPSMQTMGAQPMGMGQPQAPPMGGQAMPQMGQMGPNMNAPGMPTGGPQVPGPTATGAAPMPPPGMGPGMTGMLGQVGTPPQLNLAQLPPEVIQYIQQLEKMVAQLQGQNSDSGAQSSDSSDSSSSSGNSGSDKPFGKSGAFNMNEDAFYEELSKAIRDEDEREAFTKALQTQFASYEEKISKAEDVAKAERELRLEREFIAKAANEFNVPVAATELGPVLKRAYESLSEEDFAVIVKVLDAATELAEEIYGEVGKRGMGDNADIFDAVEAEAETLRKSYEMSAEQATAAVFEANPQAYDQYLQTRRGRG